MVGLTISDFILFPAYLYIIILIFRKIRNRYIHDKQLVFYFTLGFRIKIFIIVIYTLLCHFMIRGDGVDLYFGEGKSFTSLILKDFSNIDLLTRTGGEYVDNLAGELEKGFLKMESNYMVVKVSIIFCLLTFSHFLLVNLLIGFIVFLGSWRLFLFFREIYPALHREFAVACMGIPTVLFWSAGISKDAICVASMGFMTKAVFDLVNGRKKRLMNIAITALGIYLIYNIKPYIAFSYLPFLSLFMLLFRINKTSNPLVRFALKATIPIIFIGFLTYIANNSQDFFADFSTEKVLANISGTQNAFIMQAGMMDGAFFTLGEFDGTIQSLVRMAPKAIGTTFFRPFIWESRNLIMLLSAVESLLLSIFTLKMFFSKSGKGFLLFFKTIFTNPLVFYCIAFALVFGLFVGVSTFNFGSLVRYKIPCMPFFLAALVIIWKNPPRINYAAIH